MRSGHVMGALVQINHRLGELDLPPEMREKLFAVLSYGVIEEHAEAVKEIDRLYSGLPEEVKVTAKKWRSQLHDNAGQGRVRADIARIRATGSVQYAPTAGPETATGGPGPTTSGPEGAEAGEGPYAYPGQGHTHPTEGHPDAGEEPEDPEAADYRSACRAWHAHAPDTRPDTGTGGAVRHPSHGPAQGQGPTSHGLQGDSLHRPEEALGPDDGAGAASGPEKGRDTGPGQVRTGHLDRPGPVRGKASGPRAEGARGPAQQYPGQLDRMIQVAGPDGQYHPVDLAGLMPDVAGVPVSYIDLRDVPEIPDPWEALEANFGEAVIPEITFDRDAHREAPPFLTDIAKKQGRLYRRKSNDGKGEHYRLVLHSKATPYQALEFRKRCGDDPERVKHDLRRVLNGHPLDAGGWLADQKAYWPKGAKEPSWGEAGEWEEI